MTRQRDETGDSTLATVLIVPALLLAVMMVIQGGLYWHAMSVAEAAAQEGVAEARRYDGTEAQARAKTVETLAALGPRMLSEETISTSRTAQAASVQIEAKVTSLVPGMSFRVSVSAEGPVERYVPQE